eukprot:SAG31_NODE_11866_length_990_cov_1.529742_1_plen_101_part_10
MSQVDTPKPVEGFEWAGRASRHGIEVEIDRLSCYKMPSHYKKPIWSAQLEVNREIVVAEQRVEIAQSYMQRGKFEDAIQVLKDALDYHPRKALVHGKLGSC